MDYRYEHAEHLSSSKFFKKISVSYMYSVVSQKIVHGKILNSLTAKSCYGGETP